MKKQDIFEAAARDDSTYLYDVASRLAASEPENGTDIRNNLRAPRTLNVEEEPITITPSEPVVEAPSAGGSYYPSAVKSSYPDSEFYSDWLAIRDRLGNQAIGMNYEDWTQGNDYASLARRYSNAGKLAMQDTLGQMAARTGGLASSYAGSVAQQSYNDYMNRLQDVARSLYDSQRNEIVSNANMANTYLGSDYDRWSDQYNRELNKYQWEQEQNGQVAQLKARLSAIDSGKNTSTMSMEDLYKNLSNFADKYGDAALDSYAGNLVETGKASYEEVLAALQNLGKSNLYEPQSTPTKKTTLESLPNR